MKKRKTKTVRKVLTRASFGGGARFHRTLSIRTKVYRGFQGLAKRMGFSVSELVEEFMLESLAESRKAVK